MKHNIRIIKCLICGILLTAGVQSFSQSKYSPIGNQKLQVEGTSTIHDWEMVSSEIDGEITVSVENNKIVMIQPFKITLPVESLKSGKSGMDKNAYEALNSDKYEQIIFELLDVTQITDQLIRANCNLNISGTTNKFALEINYKLSGTSISFTGSFPITFTQFKVDPPKAMMGTIKTGDELKISFETTFTTN